MIYLLFNPLADNSKGEADARKWAVDNGVDGEFVSLLEIKDMVGFLNGLDSEDEVILTGGDGTLNHFANDVYGHEVVMTFSVIMKNMLRVTELNLGLS